MSAGEGGIALSVSALGKRFGEREALHGLDMDVGIGEIVAVIGPNGAGKTTLLSILAGVQRASAGGVSRPPHEVGWVPQRPALYSRLTVAENIRLFARLEGVADVEGALAAMLAQTGLADRADERVQRLSGGNRQRVNVAIGLLSDPPVVALDEPSTALDPAQRRRLWEFIEALASEGRAIVFSTHIVEEADRYADRVLVLDGGVRRYFGAPAELPGRRPEDRDFESALVAFLAQGGQRPAEGRPAEGRPAEEGPAEEGPAEEGPAEGRPAEGRPGEERPGDGREQERR